MTDLGNVVEELLNVRSFAVEVAPAAASTDAELVVVVLLTW